MEPITYNLKRLLDFSGRESRRLFWPYVGGVYVASTVGGVAIFLPTFISTFGRLQQFAADHPDQATVTTGPGSYSVQIHGAHPELAPDFSEFVTGVALVAAIVVILLAAAVARRLHDRGWAGWWGLAPLPFLANGMFTMRRLFAGGDRDFSDAGYLFLNNFVYIVVLGLLVVLLAGASQARDNRYGAFPPP